MDKQFETPGFDPSMIGASLYYVQERGRVAKKASITAYGGHLAAELSRWQEELRGTGEAEATTVAVVDKTGQLRSYAGPMTYARYAALSRAGITGLPTYGPNRR